MSTLMRIVSAFVLTLGIFAASMIITMVSGIHVPYIPSTFWLHTSMLVLTVFCAWVLRRKDIWPLRNVSISFLSAVKAFLWSFLMVTISVMLFMAITTALGYEHNGKSEHFVFQTMQSWQILLFVVIWASIAEEFLVRGLLQTMLAPLKKYSVPFFGTRITWPVILSGIVFGLMHVGLIKTGASMLFVVQIIVVTTVLGWCAGYFREKYNSMIIAILIHAMFNMQGLLVHILRNVD